MYTKYTGIHTFMYHLTDTAGKEDKNVYCSEQCFRYNTEHYYYKPYHILVSEEIGQNLCKSDLFCLTKVKKFNIALYAHLNFSHLSSFQRQPF